MVSIEIRVNTTLIGYIYVKNITDEPYCFDPTINHIYTFEYYKPESDSELIKERISHRRDLGIEKLIKKIIDKIVKIQDNEKKNEKTQ